MTDGPIDIAIVGGGVSGLYSAWRLKQDRPQSKIVVFKCSDAVGGRLCSVRPPGIDNMVAELGGMRILPAVQPLIKQLIQVLNKQLTQAQQITLYKFPVEQPQNIAYLRGVHLRQADFTSAPDKVPYHLSFLERGETAGSIIINAIEQIVPGITARGLHETQRRTMARQACFGGAPLYQQGFWNVLLRVMSGEAYQLGVDAGGYHSTLTNWNAADAIPWYLSDFDVHAQYEGFTQGFQQVPNSLAQLFTAAGGDLRLNAKLDGFDCQDGTFTLQVGTDTLRARALILAMPRRALEIIAPLSPLLRRPAIQSLIASVTPRPLFKLFTTYSNPWWRAAGYTQTQSSGKTQFVSVESGRTVTDLPIRQTYYWPTDKGHPVRSGRAMLMASYDDGIDIGFWDGLRRQRRQDGSAGQAATVSSDPFLGTGSVSSGSPWDQYQASRRMVDEVARQLQVIHGLPYTPQVLDAAFRDWGDDPFGGGWNSWNIGVKSWEVQEQIVQPNKYPLYICGEAYSDAQGWVEGALQTAEMMLVDKFRLPSLA